MTTARTNDKARARRPRGLRMSDIRRVSDVMTPAQLREQDKNVATYANDPELIAAFAALKRRR